MARVSRPEGALPLGSPVPGALEVLGALAAPGALATPGGPANAPEVPGAPAALGVAAGKVQIRHAEAHVIDPAGKAFVLAGLTWSGVSAQALEAKGTAELDRIWEWAVARGYTQETGEYVELNGVLGVQQGLRARQERRQGLNRP